YTPGGEAWHLGRIASGSRHELKLVTKCRGRVLVPANLSRETSECKRGSAANPKFAQHCREFGCELRVQSGTRIIGLLVSFDSEVRIRARRKVERTSESGH